MEMSYISLSSPQTFIRYKQNKTARRISIQFLDKTTMRKYFKDRSL